MAGQVFSYKARTRRGQLLRGSMSDRSAEAVTRRLHAQGYTVLSVSSATQQKSLWEKLTEPRGRIPAANMALLCRQFEVMLASGMSVVESMRLVADLMKDVRLKNALLAANQSVLAGSTFGAALGEHDHVFPPLVVQMVSAGEATGSLHEVMERLAMHYEREAETQAKIKEALAYPMIVALAAVIAITVIVFFVLPTFVDLFASMQMELPPATRFVLSVSEFLIQWWWLLASVIVIGALALQRWLVTPRGNWAKDRLLLNAPLLGPTVRRAVSSRFCRSLSLLSKSGIPMVEALRIVEQLVMNAPVAQATNRVRRSVEHGSSLTAAMRKETVFPRMLVQMVQVGEESGSLDLTMDQLAEFCDREVAHNIRHLTTLIEPVVIVLMTGVVLLLALAVVIPMFQMSTSIPGA